MKDNIDFDVQCPFCYGYFNIRNYSMAKTTPLKFIKEIQCPGCTKRFGVQIQINYYEHTLKKIEKDI